MTYISSQGDGLISRVHNVAICSEIGEQLRHSLVDSEMPEHLLLLMKSLHAEPDRIDSD